MPSEQVIGFYALRGYRGPPVMVSAEPYFDALRLSAFLKQHARDMVARPSAVSRDLVELDVDRLEQLANSCDAVRVFPIG
jgi:hypothetical protein